MVLTTGDLPGFALHSDGAEKLKDQLPAKGTPHAASIEQAVRASWLASEHSDVISADGKVQLISDANMFRSAAAARHVWRLEQVVSPGTRVRHYPLPPGAPKGAELIYENSGHAAGFELGWPQGQVIAFTAILAHPTDRFSRVQARRIGAFLAMGARAQSERIGNAVDGAAA